MSVKMNRNWVIVLMLFCVFFVFFYFDAGQYLNLEYIKQQQSSIDSAYQQNPASFILLFSFSYILMTALSIPGATLFTLVAGALFGLMTGTIIVSFASTIGATLAFLASRYLFRDKVQSRYGDKLEWINNGIEEDGAYYLFTLRLVPYIPFFLINLLMGMTRLPTAVYFFVSQIGMLPATIIYVNAGKQLASINSLSDIVSPTIILSFTILGLFPLLAKKVVNTIRQGKSREQNESL